MKPDDKQAALNRERERQRTILAYHRLFESEEGRVVLDDLKKAFATELQMFSAAQDFNPIPAAIRDGQRGVVLHIEAMLRRQPAADGNLEEPKKKVLK
jgi:hypothetical protein